MKNRILVVLLLFLLIVNHSCIFRRTSVVKIDTEPEGGDVFIRDLKDKSSIFKNLGKTPVNVKIKEGVYEIRIEKDNYLTYKERIEISKISETFNFKLEEVPVLYIKDFGPVSCCYIDESSLILGKDSINILTGEVNSLFDNKLAKQIVDFMLELDPDLKIIRSKYSDGKIEVLGSNHEKQETILGIGFLDKMDKNLTGILLIDSIFMMGEEFGKTHIEYFDLKNNTNWKKEIEGNFITLLNGKLYFENKERVIIIIGDRGELEGEINLNKLKINFNKLYMKILPSNFKEDEIYFIEKDKNTYRFVILDLNKKGISSQFKANIDFEIENIKFYGDKIFILNNSVGEGILINKFSGDVIRCYSFKFEDNITDQLATEDFIFITSHKDNDFTTSTLYCFDMDSKELIFKYNKFPIRDIIGCYKSSILLIAKQCYLGTGIIAIKLPYRNIIMKR